MKQSFLHLWALWKKEGLQLLRDPLLLLIFLLAVTVQLVLFGYSTDSKLKNISLIYSDQDNTAISRELIRSLLPGGYFKLVDEVGDADQVLKALEENRAQVGLAIPKSFSERLIKDKDLPLQFIFDGAQSNSALLSQVYLLKSVENFFRQSHDSDGAGMETLSLPKLKARIHYLHNPELKDSFFVVSGLMGSTLALLVTVMAAAMFIREKESGTLASLQVSPIQPVEFFLGKAMVIFIVAALNALIGYAVACWVFGIPLQGSLLMLILSSVFFISFCIAFGFLAARISKTQYQAIVTCLLFLFPAQFTSGAMGNYNNWPWVLKVMSWFNPQFYYVQLSRGSLYLGQGWQQLWPSFVILFMMTLVCVSLCLQQSRRFFLETRSAEF